MKLKREFDELSNKLSSKIDKLTKLIEPNQISVDMEKNKTYKNNKSIYLIESAAKKYNYLSKYKFIQSNAFANICDIGKLITY